MPVTFSNRQAQNERIYQTAMDWVRRVMQLASLAVIILYGYLFYGLFVGGIGQWASVDPEGQRRLAQNALGAIFYLNIALGALLVSVSLLYYDEEATGYTMVAAALFLYYGLPFVMNMAFAGQFEEWTRSRNTAALAIFGQLRLAGLMMAIPGAILLLRDVHMRVVLGVSRSKEDFTAMQYGGAVQEEEPVRGAPIGVMAKCWQMVFCRDAIRRRCPIYHARTRCWKERVGCMCEENVIRHAMDAIINKEIINFSAEPARQAPAEGYLSFEESDLKPADEASAEPEKTEEIVKPERPEVYIPPSRKQVKIPHNPNLTAYVKAERCRNCVIYNEHQRLKYQFFAPLFVIGVPALAYWKIDLITGTLNRVLQTVDLLMSRLSLERDATTVTLVSNITKTSDIAQYMVVGCLIVIATTMALRALEWAIFKVKI